jgi:radical SAM enzyme (TIGR01210 family)
MTSAPDPPTLQPIMCPQASEQILSGSQRASKTFEFVEQDPARPVQWWFQTASEGLVLFVVFYTQACRWNRCTGCNLPSTSSLHPIGYAPIIAQIDHVLALPDVRARLRDIRKVILSNNGSMLDEVTFPSTALFYLLSKLNLELEALQVLSIESRVEYVDWDEIAYIARALKEHSPPATLELAVGIEAFDDKIRNEAFNKGLMLPSLEKLVALMAPHRYRLKCYFMQKPVADMTDEAAVRDIQQAIDYLHGLSVGHGIPINMHLNPTFVARGTTLEPAFVAGRYTPPQLVDVARAALHARGKSVSIYIGLNDEGLAAPGGSFLRPGQEKLVALLAQFNESHDFDLLQQVAS